jgi:hypothetical protein
MAARHVLLQQRPLTKHAQVSAQLFIGCRQARQATSCPQRLPYCSARAHALCTPRSTAAIRDSAVDRIPCCSSSIRGAPHGSDRSEKVPDARLLLQTIRDMCSMPSANAAHSKRQGVMMYPLFLPTASDCCNSIAALHEVHTLHCRSVFSVKPPTKFLIATTCKSAAMPCSHSQPTQKSRPCPMHEKPRITVPSTPCLLCRTSRTLSSNRGEAAIALDAIPHMLYGDECLGAQVA